ncbi:EGF-like domain-containing protein [Nephila pilipes]|uniref:EGF-like domain-containing protein n=1 Tax=Nephila pilipes TaxID=299642 RepID=A0A8X6PQ38_NEPPI|nr:EGF-like domain-containing protein [Nephila pilipes]
MLVVHVFVILCSTFQVLVTGLEEPFQGSTEIRKYDNVVLHRKTREIRKGAREGRLLYETSEESFDPRKGLIFHNRPSEPLHDLYRKGFSHLHVPDFHRQAVEERIPVRGGGNQSIDDIISGIIHLLGGDVHVTRPETRVPTVLFPSSSRPTRINNRGPANFDGHRRNASSIHIQSTISDISSSSTSVIESSSTSDNRLIFPDHTGVSRILGLLNDTSSFSEYPSTTSLTSLFGDNKISSGELEIVEFVPSSDSERHFTFSSPSSELSSIKETIQPSIKITPTGVLTELDRNGHTILETVIQSEIRNTSHIQKTTSIDQDLNLTPSSTTRTTINHTELPIILPSMISPHTTNSSRSFPSGPITEWLPIAKPPERSSNFTGIYRPKPEEPVIITRPPDNFEITVTQQMYSNQSTTQTKTEIPVPTFTSLITPSDVTSSTDISVSIVSTQVDIIYGRPSMSALPPPPPPPPPTGRPQVYPVDISEIRPSTRPNIYQRPPRPPDFGISKYGNGLRPAQIPRPGAGPILRKPPAFRPPPLPQLPEIRIDTCVVGDDSTCDVQLKEQCRTERGVSSCLCRPGYGRTIERSMCSPVVSMLLTLKVAKLADQNIDPSHFVPGSPEYQKLNFEASHAVSTLFGYSPLSDAYRGAVVNRIYFIANRMVINSTVHLSESEVRGSLRHHVEHAVATAISNRENRLGTSQLYVNGPLSALVEVEDLNECRDKILNDCSEHAVCDNLFGSFQCKCKPGYTDKFEGDPKNEGRICSACSPDYCNGKGQCVVVQGRQECRCRGNYGGSRCQVDNEVVGVSVGVSVIAIIVIAITAACLYLWNRRWKRAHQKSEASKHAGYRLQTMADHVRWGPTSPLGSTYVPSESTMQLAPPNLSSSASQLYAISTIQPPRRIQRNQMYEEDANPYGRIIRTLQKHNSLNHSGGLQYDTLNSECPSAEEIGFPSVPSNSFVYHGTFPDRSNIYR